MKAKKHIFKSALLLSVMALAVTSCQDWLTVYPQTQIVEEQFWEDKNDLEGVRYAAYKQMCSTLDKLVKWGDLRSDSYDLWTSMTGSGTKETSRKYQQLRDGRMEKDSAWNYFDWSGVYTTINYCNKVLHYGPQVQERDKQFTPSEWRQMKAEITALRALNYFYLLRSFKDIPYTTKVINNDSEVQSFGATNQLVVLDSLIKDVEAVKAQARPRFSSTADTKGCITKAAIHALLSDMYLWRASLRQGRDMMPTITTEDVKQDYRNAIQEAEAAMQELAEQLEKKNSNFGAGGNQEMLTYSLQNVNLIQNEFESFTDGFVTTPASYLDIFITGNSDESIFELQFNSSDNRSNGFANSLWGSDSEHYLIANKNALDAIYGDENLKNRDCRIWYSAWNRIITSNEGTSNAETIDPCCFKWRHVNPTFPKNAQEYKGAELALEMGDKNDGYTNWIIYRLSDVMLQKAEAEVCLADLGDGDPSVRRKEALQLIHALHRRAYCNDDDDNPDHTPSEDVTGVTDNTWGSATDANLIGNLPEPKNAKGDVSKWELAVMNERQIELFAEGKRWFDLVRFAERHADDDYGQNKKDPDPREYTEGSPITNGSEGVELMIDQFLDEKVSDGNILKNRLKNRYGLYNLIYYMEIKASNGMLEQNPVWNKSTYEQ